MASNYRAIICYLRGLMPPLRVLVPVWIVTVPMLMLSAPSVSAATVYSWSHACAGSFGGNPGDCLDDYRFGDPAISSVSRGASYVETNNSGGYNYSAQAAAVAVPGRFSLYTHAGGSSDGTDSGIGYATGTAQIQYSDVISMAGGSGAGIVRIPWTIDGGVDLSGTGRASFGVIFCQLIPLGSSTGGVGCDGYPNLVDVFLVSNTAYSKTWNLDFRFQYGLTYALNTTFGISAGAGAPGGTATSDFSHTGAMQAAQFFDSFGNPVSGVTITSESGLDYSNPQATNNSNSVPEPASITLLVLGLAGLGFMRRSRVA